MFTAEPHTAESHTAESHRAEPHQSAASLPVSLLALRAETFPGQILLAVAASACVAFCAHASVRIPFTPVPFSLSDFAVVLVGLTLAPATAFAAMMLYLLEGALGMPVFAPGGLGGVAQLLGPTGGFLFAYPLAACAAGWMRRKLPAAFAANLLSALAGSALLMIAGVLWLGSLLHLTPAVALRLGLLPFLPGQAVKVLAAAGIFTSLRRWRRA